MEHPGPPRPVAGDLYFTYSVRICRTYRTCCSLQTEVLVKLQTEIIVCLLSKNSCCTMYPVTDTTSTNGMCADLINEKAIICWLLLSLETICKWQNCQYEQPHHLSEKYSGFSVFYEKFGKNCVQTCVNKCGTFTVSAGESTGIPLMWDFLQSITYYSDTTYPPRVKTSYHSTSPQNPSLTGNVVAIYSDTSANEDNSFRNHIH